MKQKILTENQYKILAASSDEWCYPYSHFESETGLDRKTLQKEMKQLRELGLMEYVRGLMTEDGEVAGSGFGRPYRNNREIEELIANYEGKQVKPKACLCLCCEHTGVAGISSEV